MSKRKAIDVIPLLEPIPMPWKVHRFLGGNVKDISFGGDSLSIGEDYGSIKEVRESLDWLVDQLGGKVTWKDPK